jgi:hypothetical protein
VLCAPGREKYYHAEIKGTEAGFRFDVPFMNGEIQIGSVVTENNHEEKKATNGHGPSNEAETPSRRRTQSTIQILQKGPNKNESTTTTKIRKFSPQK